MDIENSESQAANSHEIKVHDVDSFVKIRKRIEKSNDIARRLRAESELDYENRTVFHEVKGIAVTAKHRPQEMEYEVIDPRSCQEVRSQMKYVYRDQSVTESLVFFISTDHTGLPRYEGRPVNSELFDTRIQGNKYSESIIPIISEDGYLGAIRIFENQEIIAKRTGK